MAPSPLPLIVLSSSRGTTLESVLQAIAQGSLSAVCLGLVTDRPDRGCIEKARQAGIPIAVVQRGQGEDRETYDKRIDRAMRVFITDDVQPEKIVVCALGWMFILSPWFVSMWQNRIVNVHPSLLPKHPGAHSHADVLKAGDTESGMTIHLIDEGVDTGRILLQRSCPVAPDDTEETLKARVQELEKLWYPKALQMIARGELSLDAATPKN